MAGNLGTVMDNIGLALDMIPGVRAYDFPPKSAQPPFGFVDMPDIIEYDAAMKRGKDRMRISVVLAVADVVDRQVRDDLAAYMATTGDKSVKTTLETMGAGIGDSVRVTSADPRPVTIAGTQYMGIVFELDVIF